MGYTTKPPPKRELLLEEGMEFLVFPSGFRRADDFWGSNPILSPSMTVADRIAIMLQHPGPQGGGGQGGNYTTQ